MKVERLLTKDGNLVDGPLLITPSLYVDERGFFMESWNKKDFCAIMHKYGQACHGFVQDNHSRSTRGVLRGLHYQSPPEPQAKLVRCVVGEIFDVAVDIRCESPTFGQYVSAYLSSSNNHQLWIPEGFAHGFLTLTESAEVLYKASSAWNRDLDRSLFPLDEDLDIQWPILDNAEEPILSSKDKKAPTFGKYKCAF